jgi:hypothetical protein
MTKTAEISSILPKLSCMKEIFQPNSVKNSFQIARKKMMPATAEKP